MTVNFLLRRRLLTVLAIDGSEGGMKRAITWSFDVTTRTKRGIVKMN